MRVSVRATSLAFAALLVAGTASAQTTAPKFGFINSSAILSQAPGRAEAEAQFEKEVGSFRAQLQRMGDSLQNLAAAFEREAPRLDSVTRETRRKSIGDREAEYQTRANQLNQSMQARQTELVRPIMEQIQKVIEAVRVEDNYAIIFDVGSQGTAIVAADKRLDITEKVLAKLKAAAPARPGTARPATTQQPAGVQRR